MNAMLSVDRLADIVNAWCEQHGVSPANGQAGGQLTARNIRYYRTLGLLDPPQVGGGRGFGEKHRLQLVAIRLLQAQGLPLSRIRELLFGRSLAELQRIERQGLAELQEAGVGTFRPSPNESWGVTVLNDEFLVISRRGRRISGELGARLLDMLNEHDTTGRRAYRRRGERK